MVLVSPSILSNKVSYLSSRLSNSIRSYIDHMNCVIFMAVPFITFFHILLVPFFIIVYMVVCGFGGLGVACWPLVPKFAGSNPAEAVRVLRAKKSSARLPSEGK